MDYDFTLEEYVGDEPISEHKMRAVVVEDRSNDPGHGERLPDWQIAELKVLALSGSYIRLPSTHPIHRMGMILLSSNRHRRRIEHAWEHDLMAA